MSFSHEETYQALMSETVKIAHTKKYFAVKLYVHNSCHIFENLKNYLIFLKLIHIHNVHFNGM